MIKEATVEQILSKPPRKSTWVYILKKLFDNRSEIGWPNTTLNPLLFSLCAKNGSSIFPHLQERKEEEERQGERMQEEGRAAAAAAAATETLWPLK